MPDHHIDAERWQELVRAGRVPEPSADRLFAARERALAPLSERTRTRPRQPRRVLGAVAAATATAAALSVSFIALKGGVSMTTAGSPEGSESPSLTNGLTATSGASPQSLAPSTAPPTSERTVRGSGSLSAIYNVPTLEKFARSRYVQNVVVGNIVDVRRAPTPGAADETALFISLQITESRDQSLVGETATIWQSENGLDLVTPRLKSGDEVVALLGSTSKGETASLGLLIDSANGAGDFAWPGTPPNPDWNQSINARTVREILDPEGSSN